MKKENTTPVTKVRQPATIVRTLGEALAANDCRPLWTMSFQGIPGVAYVFAVSEHQAKFALIGNVTDFKKVTAAEKARLTAKAYAELLAAQRETKLEEFDKQIDDAREVVADAHKMVANQVAGLQEEAVT